MGNQNEIRNMEVSSHPWSVGLKTPSPAECGQPERTSDRLSLPREFAEVIVACAKALRATHVVTDAGWVVRDFTSARAQELTNRQLIVRDDHIHALEPVLELELQAALGRSAIDECQCIGPPNFNSLITLKRVDLGRTHLIFIRADVPGTYTELEMLPLTKALNLTRSESIVLLQLSGGMSPEMVAEHLNVAISTVRSHIKNLLEKTSCQDLRRLLIHVCRTLG